MKAEGRALADAGAWLEDAVIEKQALISHSKSAGVTIHMGELLSICSVKYYERAPEYHIHKGRICFRGDCARDENGALPVCQELAANPTTIHTANSNIAYGCLPGNKTTQADAIRAYIQSKFRVCMTHGLLSRMIFGRPIGKAFIQNPCASLNALCMVTQNLVPIGKTILTTQ